MTPTASDLREYTVAVFVEQRARGYQFRAYLRDYHPSWPGCNVRTVSASSGEEAKRNAIAGIKANMDLKSKIVPTGINVHFSESVS